MLQNEGTTTGKHTQIRTRLRNRLPGENHSGDQVVTWGNVFWIAFAACCYTDSKSHMKKYNYLDFSILLYYLECRVDAMSDEDGFQSA